MASFPSMHVELQDINYDKCKEVKIRMTGNRLMKWVREPKKYGSSKQTALID